MGPFEIGFKLYLTVFNVKYFSYRFHISGSGQNLWIHEEILTLPVGQIHAFLILVFVHYLLKGKNMNLDHLSKVFIQ